MLEPYIKDLRIIDADYSSNWTHEEFWTAMRIFLLRLNEHFAQKQKLAAMERKNKSRR